MAGMERGLETCHSAQDTLHLGLQEDRQDEEKEAKRARSISVMLMCVNVLVETLEQPQLSRAIGYL